MTKDEKNTSRANQTRSQSERPKVLLIYKILMLINVSNVIKYYHVKVV